MVVFGTGVSMREEEKVHGSIVVRTASEAILAMEVGTFDARGLQEACLSLRSQYVGSFISLEP